MSINFPKDLIGRVQYAFVGSRYKNGVYVVPTMKEEEIQAMFEAFFEWCFERGLVSEELNYLDISSFLVQKEK